MTKRVFEIFGMAPLFQKVRPLDDSNLKHGAHRLSCAHCPCSRIEEHNHWMRQSHDRVRPTPTMKRADSESVRVPRVRCRLGLGVGGLAGSNDSSHMFLWLCCREFRSLCCHVFRWNVPRRFRFRDCELHGDITPAIRPISKKRSFPIGALIRNCVCSVPLAHCAVEENSVRFWRGWATLFPSSSIAACCVQNKAR